MLKIHAMSSVRAFVPRPRSRGITVQEVDGETLLYVEETHQASCLNASAARIWNLCNGQRNTVDIAAGAGLHPDVVAQVLKEFGHAGLLENSVSSPLAIDVSRRRLLVGVGLAAIPVVLLVTAPKARAAGSLCTPIGDHCDSGTPPCCNNGTCVPGPNMCAP
jgi:hypothetical protein